MLVRPFLDTTDKRKFVWMGVFASTCLVAVWVFASQGKIAQVSESDYKVDYLPIRGEIQPLRLQRGGFTYNCNECHRVFESVEGRKRLIAEHTDINLNHGANDYCFNCHHRSNRNAYAAHDGSEIPSTQPARLCGKCHGLVYRDWENGVHGRKSGYWDGTQGNNKQLLCIQCHDPHSPKFPSLKPMPGPYARKGE
jgi:hypothetical protein